MFESTTVHSYPAVHVDDDKRGHCTVDVGVADDTLLIVTAAISDPKAPGYDDPCTDADRLASSIVGYQGHRAP